MQRKPFFVIHIKISFHVWNLEKFKGLFTRREGYPIASGLTLAGGQKIARVYKQNFTDRVTLQFNPAQIKARLHSKGLETIRKLIRVRLVLTRVKLTRPPR